MTRSFPSQEKRQKWAHDYCNTFGMGDLMKDLILVQTHNIHCMVLSMIRLRTVCLSTWQNGKVKVIAEQFDFRRHGKIQLNQPHINCSSCVNNEQNADSSIYFLGCL